jgi:hypothetical protein
MERRAASLRRLDAFRSGDIDTVTGPTPASPARFLPIRRFMCRRRRGSLGSPRFGYHVGLFPSSWPATVLAFLPSLAKASLCESSFRSATPPRSSFTSQTPLAGLSTRAAPTRDFGPPHDNTNPRPLPRKLPKLSLRSVLGRSQPLDGFLRKLACRLISSRSRVQDQSCSGAHSLRAAVLSRR